MSSIYHFCSWEGLLERNYGSQWVLPSMAQWYRGPDQRFTDLV